MANFKDETRRFREALAKTPTELQGAIYGEEPIRTKGEKKAIVAEALEISAKIENRTKILDRANTMIGVEIKDVVDGFKRGEFIFIDAELLSDKEWEELNDVLWMRESVQFVKYGDKMRLTQVAGPDRLKKVEKEYKLWHPNASLEECRNAKQRAVERDNELLVQEMLMIQKRQDR